MIILFQGTGHIMKVKVATRFLKKLKGKIYKIMITNDRKSYLGYLNK